MSQELLKMIDRIAREKNIDPGSIFEDLELAMLSAIRKAYAEDTETEVSINRNTGDIAATVDGEPMSMENLGRIAAQTAKQVIIQKIKESERGSIFDEFVARRGEIVTGRVLRWEGGALVVELERCEAYLPKTEQIPGDSHQIDSRLRAMILEVRQQPGAVKIILSRTHPDFIRSLFELEVPEVHEGIIDIEPLAREAGYRTKVAVRSNDPKVDAVGACVGIRGSRIRNIVDELGGEKIDIVRWNESSKVLIANALKPAEISEVALCFELGRATVVVNESQLSLAIGKRGQNVRLAARLTNWDVDILTPDEFNASLDILEKTIKQIEGVDSTILDQISAMGLVSVMDVEEVGVDPLVNELEMEAELAQTIVDLCSKESRRLAELKAAKKAETLEEENTPVEGEEEDSPTPDEENAPVTDNQENAPVAGEEEDNPTPDEDNEPVVDKKPGSQDDISAVADGETGQNENA